MKKFFLLLFVFLSGLKVYAVKITGTVTDDAGNLLPFSSISVKSTTIGTSANSNGNYFLNLPPGTYTISCQHVGYARQEKTISVGKEDLVVNFHLSIQQLVLADVVVKKGEDPAYEIIRNAIKKRSEYLKEINQFSCEVYLKGQLSLRNYPKKFFGQNVDFEDGDTSKHKIIFLSETVARLSADWPDKVKTEVLSSKVSGQSNEFGLSSPQIISFYENNVQIGQGQGLGPRGFVSPIAEAAFNFYRYKFEGSFFEDGKQINQIRVTPRRKYEPLFSGLIFIVEDEWRIHSVDLLLTKESQMELIDTIRLQQLYSPVAPNIWALKNQVIYPAVKFLGFDATGNFVSVYSKYNLSPLFDKKFFNNTIIKFEDGSNKKTTAYWDSIRPVPLMEAEIRDYKRKDSLEQVRKEPKYLDSLDKIRNRLTVSSLLLFGKNFSNEKRRTSFTLDPILQTTNFNTVEGWNANLRLSYVKRLDSINPSKTFSIAPVIRYGFSNGRLNIYTSINYSSGKKRFSSIGISGGKRIYQFNNANPIIPVLNTYATLFWEQNYLKIYQAWFARLSYERSISDGLVFGANVFYQDRIPLENTVTHVWVDKSGREIQPNYPIDLVNQNFTRHQALITEVFLNWQPGSKYIELPYRKVNLGSKAPKFTLSYTQGIHSVLGSDVDYSKWKFSIAHDINLKLGGLLNYRLSTGGFLSTNKLQIQDYLHFNGNQLTVASEFLNSFQLLPYYKYSNTASFYSEGHLEYHLKGLLTNKIPFFRRLNWYLVTGANTFYLNNGSNYIEAFAGIENILKVLRLDFVWGFQQGKQNIHGFRIGIPLVIIRTDD